MTVDPDTPSELDPDPVTSRPRWPIGTLSVIGVAAVVALGIFLGSQGSGGSSDPTVPFTIPDLGGLDAPDPQGEAAADFTIRLFSGERFSLSEHQATDGRPIFLNLWASWCIPCREEMPAIDAAARAHPEVLFLGIAVEDDPTAAEEFAQEIGVGYPLAVEESDRFVLDYPYFGLPATFLITGDGTIAGRAFGGVTEDQIAELIDEFLAG